MFAFAACDKSTTAATTAATTATTTAATTTATTTQQVTTVDEVDPVLSGVADVYYTIDDDAPDYLANVSATDNVDGDLTASIQVDTSAVDLEVEGEYEITYTVEDAAGNTASETATVTVSVRELTDAEKVDLDLAVIDLDTSFKFNLFGPNGSRYTWTTDNLSVVTAKGSIIRPGVGEEPVTVQISVTAVKGSVSETRNIEYVVQPAPEVEVTSSKLLAFDATSEEYIVEDVAEVEVFFVNNGTLPYIDVKTYLDMIEGAIESSELVYTYIDDDKLQISYEATYEDFDGSMITEVYSNLIDFTANTFTVNSFAFFENYVSSTESDYGEGLIYVDADIFEGDEVVIPLGHYNFDILTYDRDETTYYLMPLHVTDLLFTSSIYYDVYYNGDMLYGIDNFVISSGSDEALMDQIRTSSYNDLSMAQDMRDATYHFLALSFDYFYGLKEYKGIVTFYDYLLDYADRILSASDGTLYTALFDFAYSLDDLHTSHVYPGYYADISFADGLQITTITDLGPDTQAFYTGYWRVQDWLEALYGSTSSVPEVRYLADGVTAVIFISGFTIDTPGEVEKALSRLPANIENVAIDLSYNSGGNVGAVFRIFGYMTENGVQYHSVNPADNASTTYYIESEYVAYDYNWYIISSSVTFSAANLMVSMAKEAGIATIVGQNSSGGACSISPIMTPDGTILMVSSDNVISTRTGNAIDGYEYFDIEGGIEVDYWMLNPTDDTELANVIAQDQSQ